jgi:LacI family transcriptional regulator
VPPTNAAEALLCDVPVFPIIGRSPQSEIRNVQLKRVKQLLRETDLPLERIAALAGYEHPEYMSVVFKRELGQTPGQYRTQNVKGASRRFR